MRKISFIPVVYENRVCAIKALREATGWGLKESKDFVDHVVVEMHRRESLRQDFTNATRFVLTAEQFGCLVAINERTGEAASWDFYDMKFYDEPAVVDGSTGPVKPVEPSHYNAACSWFAERHRSTV